ncbi:hypothetical protein SAY87_023339 [Trapa incisa]|uniref:DNA-directed RNA polymerase subunit n=2 Tax=Trapa TaxID=22665 RepID=A0AAN7QXX2_TRANT|nr:hypothetical protein SAY87_023339 [Trapa incisa]KAK4783107.1 hypothetical protein SAY86_007481 [Trapa natans]
MFSEVELLRTVIMLQKNLGQDKLASQRCIVTQLLRRLSMEKASEHEGYFLNVTGLKRIGKGQAIGRSGYTFFPVKFTCRTFMPVPGETLQGVVYRVCRTGAFMSCGPVNVVFLSTLKMPGYHYVAGEEPFFLGSDLSKIETGVVVQFVVLAVRWIENVYGRKELQMLASILGDNLGPISLCEW